MMFMILHEVEDEIGVAWVYWFVVGRMGDGVVLFVIGMGSGNNFEVLELL